MEAVEEGLLISQVGKAGFYPGGAAPLGTSGLPRSLPVQTHLISALRQLLPPASLPVSLPESLPARKAGYDS